MPLGKSKKKISKGRDGLYFVGYSAIDVTGSCYYIQFNGKKILIECGLHQEADYLKGYKINSQKFKFKPAEIDYVFVTHPHIDHIGLLPRLYKEGCTAKIILTHQCAVIANLLLRNCAYILSYEARIISKKFKHNYIPIYTEEDVNRVVNQFYEYDEYNHPYQLDDTISFEWLENAHCVGATQLYLTLRSDSKIKRILYTGDIGSFHTKNHFVNQTQLCDKFADVVLMESTYGDNKRTSKKTRSFDMEHLRVAIQTVIDRGGTVILPAFSFSRTQELLVSLYEMFHNDKDFKTQIIVDSKLSCDISRAYHDILESKDLQLWEMVCTWENVSFITEKSDSLACVKDHTPKIVISSSGFCTNGRVLSYLQEYLKDIHSMIIFSGYIGDSNEYLSYRIKNYKDNKLIKINKKLIQNKADAITMASFSSHANHDDLIKYGSNLNTNLLILVHGSKESKFALAKELKEKVLQNNKTYRVRVSEKDAYIYL